MSGTWAETVRFADLLSALFGGLGAIILGWPAWQATGTKANWEASIKLEEAVTDGAAKDALARLRQRLEGESFGGASASRWINRTGYGLLLISFVFLAIASIARLHEHPAAPGAQGISEAPEAELRLSPDSARLRDASGFRVPIHRVGRRRG
jgi:hypothetical protein